MECVKGLIDWERMYYGRLGGMRTLSAYSELLDNSLDARADRIDLDLYPRLFRIEDNGKGAPSLDPFFGFGVHREHEGGRGGDALGAFGVGGTHALLWISQELATRVAIVTRCKGTLRSIETTWQELADTFNRNAGAPAIAEKSAGKSGCKIELEGAIRLPNYGAEFDKLIDALSFRYSKIITEGARIVLTRHGRKGAGKTTKLEPYATPPLEQEIRDEFEVNGKRVRLFAGILPQGICYPRIGLHYRYSYRVIVESSADGCGGLATSRIFGFVDLLEGWRLDLHKDGITDPNAKELYAEVYRRMEPLLKLAQTQLMVAESRALVADVEARLNEAIGKTMRGKRGKGQRRGTQLPTGTGSPHGDAIDKQPGDRMPGSVSPRGQVHIEFVDLKDDAIGEFRSNTVRLNTTLEYVRRIRDDANADATFGAAMMIYAMSKVSNGSLDAKRFEEALLLVGKAVAPNSMPALNGKNLSESAA